MKIEKMTIVNGNKKQGRMTKHCRLSTVSTYTNRPFNETQPHPHDILCGRGGGAILKHPGNYNLTGMVQLEMEKYYSATGKRSDKTKIIHKILANISNLKPPGRFLNKIDNKWFEQTEKFARDTISKTFARETLSKTFQEQATTFKKGSIDHMTKIVTSSLVTSSSFALDDGSTLTLNKVISAVDNDNTKVGLVVSTMDIMELVKSYNDTDDNYTDDNYTDDNYTDDNYTDDNYTDDNYNDIHVDNDINIDFLLSNIQKQDGIMDMDTIDEGVDLNIDLGDDFEWKWDGTIEWNWDGEFDLNYEKINEILNL
jgi:ABC-type antimicrobial peptide transport system permease subunit